MRATAILGEGSEFDVLAVDGTAPIRIEIAQSHSGDVEEVQRKVNAELATYKDGQTEITVGIDPAVGDPVPSLDWSVGDEVFVDGAWRVVVALTCTLDDESGRWTDVPRFGVVLDQPHERIDRTLAAIGGLNKGTSHLTRPNVQAPQPNLKP